MPPTGPGRAGGCTVNITPEKPLKGYYGTEFHRGDEDSDVLAQAAVFTDGADTAAVVSVDVTAIDHAFVLGIRAECQRRTGIPAKNIFIGATHVHSAPHAAPMFLGGAHPDPVYMDFLRVRIVEAIVTAHQTMRPATVKGGAGKTKGVVFNRRLLRPDGSAFLAIAPLRPGDPMYDPESPPAGPVDEDVPYLLFDDEHGQPITCVFSFACHDHAAGTKYHHRDLGGRTGDVLKRRLGGDFPSPFLAGACGDVMWLDPKAGTKGGPKLAWEIGEKVADAIIKDAAGRPRLPIGRIRAASEIVDIPDRSPAESQYCDDLCRGDSPEEREFERKRYAPERIAVEARGRTSCAVEIGAISVGDFAISSNPAELFVEYGLEIRKRSPFAVTLVSELTNGYCGYVPTEQAHSQRAYETHRTVFTSRLALDAGRTITNRSLAVLRECRG